MNQFLLARSLCESVGWSPDLTAGALSGNCVPELDARMLELGVVLSERQDVLSLAHDLCLLRKDSVENIVKVLTSRADMLDESAGIWGIGQEWLELIRGARQSILIVAPALDTHAAGYLKNALAGAYGAQVDLTVLYGALGDADKMEAALALIAGAFPGARILRWPSERGFLHAKAICIDRSSVHLGSANLTDYGWQRNVELGVTVQGVAARALVSLCDGLVEIAECQAEHLTAALRHFDDGAP